MAMTLSSSQAARIPTMKIVIVLGFQFTKQSYWGINSLKTVSDKWILLLSKERQADSRTFVLLNQVLNSGMEESVLLSTSSSTNENEGISLKGDGSTYPGSQKKILPSIKLEMELSTPKAFVNCMVSLFYLFIMTLVYKLNELILLFF